MPTRSPVSMVKPSIGQPDVPCVWQSKLCLCVRACVCVCVHYGHVQMHKKREYSATTISDGHTF